MSERERIELIYKKYTNPNGLTYEEKARLADLQDIAEGKRPPFPFSVLPVDHEADAQAVKFENELRGEPELRPFRRATPEEQAECRSLGCDSWNWVEECPLHGNK